MIRNALLLAAALGGASLSSTAATAAADGATTICHRTGQVSREGLFVGHVLNVSARAVPNHLTEHGDLVAEPAAAVKLRQGGRCFTDVSGNIFDAGGTIVQRAQGSGGPSVPPPGDGPG